MADGKEKLFKMIKQMSPGDVMAFCAERLGVNPTEMLLKNAGTIALSAVKNGWAKAGSLKDAVKNFSAKNKEDDTGIDWDGVQIDEMAVKLQCLFDGDSGKKLKEFCKKLQSKMKDFAEEDSDEGNDEDDGSEGGEDADEVDESEILNEGLKDKVLEHPEFFKKLAKYVEDQCGPDAKGSKARNAVQDFLHGAAKGLSKAENQELNKEFTKIAGGIVQRNSLTGQFKDMFDTPTERKDFLNSLDKALKSASDGAKNAVDQADAVEQAASAAKDPEAAIQAAGPAKAAAKDMANDEEMKKEVAKKSGLKAFTPLGWARLAAKTTGYILNNGKDLVNWMGEKKIKNSEDKNVIAEIRMQIENAGGSDYADSEFSVRFTTDDFKWHATCIDDRKMRFDGQKLIDKVLATDTGRKFKEYCLKRWKSLVNPAEGSDYAMLPFILKNMDKFGLKGDDAFFGKVKALADNMDKIEAQFK